MVRVLFGWFGLGWLLVLVVSVLLFVFEIVFEIVRSITMLYLLVVGCFVFE